MDNSKMKPNKLKACENSIKNSNFKVDVPNEINRSDRYHFHVLMVDNNFNKTENKIEYRVKHQMFNEKSYEVFKNSRKRITTSTLFLLHDPIQQRKVEADLNAREEAKTKEELEKIKLAEAEAKAKAEEEAKARAKAEEEANAKIEAEEAKKLAEEAKKNNQQ